MNSRWNLPFTIDAWLWKRGLGHPVVMPIVRNEIVTSCVLLCAGLLVFPFSSWLFWFGFGSAIMALTFFTLAHFFLRLRLDTFSSTLFFRVLIRWLGRLFLTALFLYCALVLCAAQVSAILAGLICASLLALITYACVAKRT